MSSSERPSAEPILKIKRGVPSRTEGEIILEMLWKPQMPWIRGFGASQPYSRGELQETLRAFPGSFQNFFPGISSGKSQPYWGCGPVTLCTTLDDSIISKWFVCHDCCLSSQCGWFDANDQYHPRRNNYKQNKLKNSGFRIFCWTRKAIAKEDLWWDVAVSVVSCCGLRIPKCSLCLWKQMW